MTWLLPMIWMEEEVAMRKRGSSRKKLRMEIASNTSPPTAKTTAAAATMRPVAGGRDETAADRHTTPGAQEPVFLGVQIVVGGLIGRSRLPLRSAVSCCF